MAIDLSAFSISSKGTSVEAKIMLGLAGFGILSLAYLSTKFFAVFFKIFLMPGTSLRKFGPKGSWAVVTGASDGIGKEFVFQLAAKGFNIVLVSRTESKLREIATEIISKYSVEAKYLPMDFTRNLDTDYDKLQELVRGLDVAILVNNVGKSHDMPVPFVETERKEMDDIIIINCVGTLRVTKLIAPGMVERKRGLILTMGSFAGLTPTPLLATYSGSKAFLSHWSTALASELAPKGVRVELINSYLVTSAMSKIRRPNMTTPTAKAFVRSALKSVGVYMGSTTGVVTPYWSHAVLHWAMDNILGLGGSTLVGINKSIHEGIRKRALRKKEREAKKQ